MQIPFALIPLLTLVSNEHVMGVFTIGTAMRRTVWAMAALVIVINGYVLLDFFKSEVKGLFLGLMVCVGALAYLAFILYLISRGGGLPLFSHMHSNGFAQLKS